MDVRGVSMSTASNMDNGHAGFTLFHHQQYGHAGCTPCHTSSMHARGVPLSTTSRVNVLGVSKSIASSIDVQGVVSLFTFLKCFENTESRAVRHQVSAVPE